MVCSACGYENQTGHRFCGMCGMPLPHRPLTAPGASSTLNLTRVPVESGSAAQHSVSGRTSVLTEHPASQAGDGSASNASGQTMVDPRIAADEAVATEHASISSEEPRPKELVPDLPLDEYVKSFRYEPPSDPTEITMRGDASVQDAAVPGSDTTSAAASTSAKWRRSCLCSFGYRNRRRAAIAKFAGRGHDRRQHVRVEADRRDHVRCYRRCRHPLGIGTGSSLRGARRAAPLS